MLLQAGARGQPHVHNMSSWARAILLPSVRDGARAQSPVFLSGGQILGNLLYLLSDDLFHHVKQLAPDLLPQEH